MAAQLLSSAPSRQRRSRPDLLATFNASVEPN
jgi:hypothetical protein